MVRSSFPGRRKFRRKTSRGSTASWRCWARDHPGERAAAALKAVAFLKRHELSWLDVLEGRALPRGNVRPRRLDSSDDDLKAAESRLRQMRAHNDALERQIKRLKTTIDALQPPK